MVLMSKIIVKEGKRLARNSGHFPWEKPTRLLSACHPCTTFSSLHRLRKTAMPGGTGGKKQGYGSGKQTLRFKANGPAKVEEVDDARTLAEEKINELLENFLGINDADLGNYF